jgi:histidinol dehydrogenase
VSALLPAFRLNSRAGERKLALLADRARRVLDPEVEAEARRLTEAVRRGGDRALLRAARRLDGARAATAAGLALGPPEAGREEGALPPGFAAALDLAIANVERFHRRQLRSGYRLEARGAILEERREPLRRVGIYVPGGRASYPSTAVMTVVPARLAGVEEIAVATPPAAYAGSAPLRYALARLGIREVWGMGGAHAVAALAYGTETVRRVDKVVGPGNAWVTAAKRLVAGAVGIDGLAGPTELVVAADAAAEPALVAADLLAQAEHDPRAAVVLVTDSPDLARRVRRELGVQLRGLATAATCRAALASFGCAFLVTRLEQALPVIEALAPEHLQLVGTRAEALLPRVRSAGAVFVGPSTSEVFGDYLAGGSHVLPTCGSARFASALGVDDFVRRSHVVSLSAAAAARWAEPAAVLAAAEGLPAHAAAARRRLAAPPPRSRPLRGTASAREAPSREAR